MVTRTGLPRTRQDVAILGRSEWAGGLGPTGTIDPENDVRFLLVHHTVANNTYAEGDVAGILRSYYHFHTSAEKGWPDIAYNFLVDRFGRVWEGRAGSIAGPVQGSATGGSQGFALLCAFIGDHSSNDPSEEAIDAMGRLLGSLANRYGISVAAGSTTTFTSRGSNKHPEGTQVTASTISAHRDMSQTACPGDAGVAVISNRLIPIASGASAAGATTTTTTVAETTTTAEATTTSESTTTTGSVATEASTTVPSTDTSVASNSSTDTVEPGGDTTVPNDATTLASSGSSGEVAQEVGLGTGTASDEADWVRIGGPVGLVTAGLAGLIALRRRTSD